jgi:hypothetical protein
VVCLSKNDQERKKSNASPEASRFHTTLPLDNATTISDDEYKLMVRHKAGMRSTDKPLPDLCHHCRKPISDSIEDSWHPVFCKHHIPTASNQKHNEIAELIADTARKVGAGYVQKETRPPCSEADKKRMDLRIELGLGKRLLVDVTARAFKATSRRTKPHRLFEEAERDKTAKYRDMVQQEHGEFYPFVVNELGKLGPKATQFLSLLWSYGEVSGGKSKSEMQTIRNCFYSSLIGILTNKSMKTAASDLGMMVYMKGRQLMQDAKSAGLMRDFKAELRDRIARQQPDIVPMQDELSEQSELEDEEDASMPDADSKESKAIASPTWLSEQLNFGNMAPSQTQRGQSRQADAQSHSSSSLSHANIPASAQSTQLQQQNASVNNLSVAPLKNQSGQLMLQTDSSAASPSSHMDDDELMWPEPVQGSSSGSEPSASSS